MRTSIVASVAGAWLVAAIAWGCSHDDCKDFPNLCSAATDDGGGEAGGKDAGPGISDSSSSTEGGNVVDAPAGCDPTKPPKDSPACVDEGVGVFVDSNAPTNGMGTRAAPFKTIGDAVAGNTSNRPRIYVCEGAYAENVVETNLDIYGGFTCSGAKWVYDANKAGATKVTGANDGAAKFAALHLTVAKSVQIADIDFSESDAPANSGGSSIGAWVEGSGSVTFTNVGLTAGKGADAPPAVAPDDNLFKGDAGGAAANGVFGGAPVACACPKFGNSLGGAGGNAGDPAQDGGTGSSSPAAIPTSALSNGVGGQGYNSGAGVLCSPGHDGADGAPRDGGAAAAGPGKLDSAGWTPARGNDGLPGAPGGGGGGGGGGKLVAGGSGGGGCGGCGGGGGKGGAGGGASIALLVNNVVVSLTNCSIHATAAGGGALGGTGGAGGGGGGGGNVGACGGGGGGNGSGGGGGGGGVGGVSVAIGWAGKQPIKDGATVADSAATGGTPGPGGAGGAGPGQPGMIGANGADGVAGSIVQLQ